MLRTGAKGRYAVILRDLQIPVPVELGQFVTGLKRQRRRRPILLRPFSSGPEGPCGLWIGTADAGYIYHEAGPPRSTPPISPCMESRTRCWDISIRRSGNSSSASWRLMSIRRSSG